MPHFHPKTVSEEFELLLSDDSQFQKTTEYLSALIEDVLSRFVMTSDQYREIHEALVMDIPIAANRYLHNKRDISGGYRFSTYFTAYISERINGASFPEKET